MLPRQVAASVQIGIRAERSQACNAALAGDDFRDGARVSDLGPIELRIIAVLVRGSSFTVD